MTDVQKILLNLQRLSDDLLVSLPGALNAMGIDGQLVVVNSLCQKIKNWDTVITSLESIGEDQGFIASLALIGFYTILDKLNPIDDS